MPEVFKGRMDALVNDNFVVVDESWDKAEEATKNLERSKPLAFPMTLLDTSKKWQTFVMSILKKEYFERRTFEEQWDESKSLLNIASKVFQLVLTGKFDDILELRIEWNDFARISLPKSTGEIQIPLLFDYAFFLKQQNLRSSEITDIIQQVNISFGSPQAVLLGVYLGFNASEFIDIFSRKTNRGIELTNAEPNPLRPYVSSGVIAQDQRGGLEISQNIFASEIFTERYNRLSAIVGKNNFVRRRDHNRAVGLLEGMYKFGKRLDPNSEYYKKDGSLDLFNFSTGIEEFEGFVEIEMLPGHIIRSLAKRNLIPLSKKEITQVDGYITTNILKAKYSSRLVRGSVTDKRISHLRDVMKTSKRRGDEQ